MRNILIYRLCLLSIFFVVTHCSFASAEPPILPVEKAFVFQALSPDSQTLQLDWSIAPGYYLYQDQLKVLNAENQSLLEEIVLPTGIEKEDEIIGKIILYSTNLTINIPLRDNIGAHKILVQYQGCAENGFCYAPVQKLIDISEQQQIKILTTDMEQFPSTSKVDDLVSGIKQDYLPLTLAVFFVLGILLSFTPCVLPMIPLLVNLIVGCKKISTHKAAALTSSYILGMAGTYAIAGSIAGMLGARFQAWLQMPIVLITFSCMLVVIALSQLDLIKISVPSFNRRLHHWGQKQLQGSLIGAFVLGIISSLIISPCVTPPLIGVLTYIGQNGSAVIGGLTLFFLGLGMGVPLIIVAMLSSVILPKAGPWMNLIKATAAVALLGLAIWIISGLVSAEVLLALWGALCVVYASHLQHGHKYAKWVATIVAVLGISLVAIAINFKYNLFFSNQVIYVNTNNSKWNNIQSTADLELYLERALKKQQPIIIDVYADWCASCRRIEKLVFADPKVIAALENYMLLRIDLTEMSMSKDALLDKLEIYGPPAILFFNADGTEQTNKRLVGSIDATEFLTTLQTETNQ